LFENESASLMLPEKVFGSVLLRKIEYKKLDTSFENFQMMCPFFIFSF